VGHAHVPVEPPVTAHAFNAEGLELLRKKDASTARARFDDAVRRAPEWQQFRFNRVCALVLSGQLEIAAQQLTELLWLDPTNTRGRWREDADLSALRASSFAAALEAEAERATAELKQQVPKGVAVQVSGTRERTLADGSLGADRWVQPGVYVHETGRFLPVAPRLTAKCEESFIPALAGALTDVATGRSLVLTGRGNNVDSPSIPGVFLSVFEVGATKPVWSAEFPTQDAKLIEAGWGAEAVRLRRFACAAKCDFGLFVEPKGKGFTRATDQTSHGEARLLVNQLTVYRTHAMPPGYRVSATALETPAGAIPLPKDSGQGASREPRWTLALSPDARSAAVVSWQGDIGGSGMTDAAEHSRVLWVDLQSRAVRVLATGERWAAVAFDASNALYLDLGRGVQRYSEPSTAAAESLPAGLSL
jgi:hypothetical protein